MRKLNLRAEEELARVLEERARAEGVPVSEVIRRAIRAYLQLPPQSPNDLGRLLRDVSVKLDLLEERLARIERELPITRVTPSEKPNIPEPTPEVLRRIAAKLEQREVWPDEYPGNLTAGEILLLDRLVREGRAYYDHSTRRWRIAGVQP